MKRTYLDNETYRLTARHDSQRSEVLFFPTAHFLFFNFTPTAQNTLSFFCTSQSQRRKKMKECFLHRFILPMMKPIAILFLFVLASCSCQKSISQTGIESIRFGNGGGFTGATTTYSLSANGQLNKVDGDKNTSIKKVDSKTVKELFTNAKELTSYSYNEPENMSSFLEIQTKDAKQNIVWGFGSTKVDSRVTQLYDQLITLTK